MKIETIKLWEDREDVELTTFLTMPDDFFNDPLPKPAVIVCPGGAYVSCPRHGTEGDAVAMTFAADGYQAFVLEYSVKSRAPEGKTLFPAQLYDFGKAILTIREHAKEWYVNPDQIAVIGFSAGAHLCGMLASTWHTNLLSDYFQVDKALFRPMCAILLYGLYDYKYQNEYNRIHENPLLPMDLNTHVFGTADPSPEAEEKYSPYYQVTEYMPPVFMAAAVNDGMVPSIQSVRMAEKLHTVGIPYELHMFQFGDHGFGLGRFLPEPYAEQKSHAAKEWVSLAKTFLMHQIFPETTEYEKNPFGTE